MTYLVVIDRDYVIFLFGSQPEMTQCPRFFRNGVIKMGKVAIEYMFEMRFNGIKVKIREYT